jgi:hypothetical protein
MCAKEKHENTKEVARGRIGRRNAMAREKSTNNDLQTKTKD